MKIFIIGGGGTLGSSAAFMLAQKAIADEIVLYDLIPQRAAHHAADICQAASLYSTTRVNAGQWEDMVNSDMIIVAAGVPFSQQTGQHIKDAIFLLPFLRECAQNLTHYAPNAVVLMMSNPVDVLNYWLCRLSGLNAAQFIGFSYNDVIRARWGIANVLDVPVADVSCNVIGEHGVSKVPLYSSACVCGKPAMLTQIQIEAITALNDAWWSDFLALDVQRTAGWTSAVGIVSLVEYILGIEKGPVSCSCVLDGELGLYDISIGVEAELNMHGVAKILPLRANDTEYAAFENSIRVVRTGIEALAQEAKLLK